MLFKKLLGAVFVMIAVIVLVSPSVAYVYENPPRSKNGVQIKDGTTTVMAAIPFMLAQDAYATSFAFGLGRAAGPLDAGFVAYLTDVYLGPLETAVAAWKMIPKGPVLSIYEAQLESPILLKANIPYAVMIKTSHQDFMGAIAYSGSGYYGYGSSDYGETWRLMAAPFWVRVDGYAVPEPSSMCALFSGGMLFFCLRRPRKR